MRNNIKIALPIESSSVGIQQDQMATNKTKLKDSEILDWLRISTECKRKILKKRNEFDDSKVLVRSHYRKKPKNKENVPIGERKTKKRSKCKKVQKTLSNNVAEKGSRKASATAVVVNTQVLLIEDVVKESDRFAP